MNTMSAGTICKISAGHGTKISPSASSTLSETKGFCEGDLLPSTMLFQVSNSSKEASLNILLSSISGTSHPEKQSLLLSQFNFLLGFFNICSVKKSKKRKWKESITYTTIIVQLIYIYMGQS